jgi:hypothetical protein
LPLRTPISQLGLTPAEARRLTPAARKLTKADLLAMMEGKEPRAAAALTVRDLASISQVYAASLRAAAPDLPTGCCCSCGRACCCCCCAIDIFATK